MNWLHERQPAVLTSEEEMLRWLDDGELTDAEVKDLIRPVNSLDFYPVSTLVNNARINDEQVGHVGIFRSFNLRHSAFFFPLINDLICIQFCRSPISVQFCPSSQCMAPIDLKEEEEKKKPKPNALTNWLAKGAATTAEKKVVKEETKKEAKKNDLMTSWLSKGKRKSASPAADDDDNEEERNKKPKTDS